MFIHILYVIERDMYYNQLRVGEVGKNKDIKCLKNKINMVELINRH
jgi:hypothetical protein